MNGEQLLQLVRIATLHTLQPVAVSTLDRRGESFHVAVRFVGRLASDINMFLDDASNWGFKQSGRFNSDDGVVSLHFGG